jgi:tetratricopeptide (TPR) repeat protein
MSYEMARAAYQLGDLRGALQLASQSAAGEVNPERKVSALVLEGIVLRELGHTTEAISKFELAGGSLPNVSRMLNVFGGVIAYNHALALWQDERLGDAEARLRQAIHLFCEEGMTDHQRQAMQNLSWVLADLEQFDEAERVAEAALPLCSQSEHHLRHRIVAVHIGVSRGDGSASKALEHLMLDEDFLPVITAETGALISAICARGAAIRGDLATARLHATAARQLAATQRDSRVFNVVLQAEAVLANKESMGANLMP